MDARLILLPLLLAAGSALALDHSHRAWDDLLKKHLVVLDGGRASQVRYAGVAQDRAALKGYLGELSAVTPAEFGGWTREQQMAFLINAYNAFAVEKILMRYPEIRSIWDFGKLFSNPFKDRFFVLFGKNSSLDEIEHEILRPKYKDPRVHYAVNCASVGCPMLREEAYVAERLDRQLDEQAARFLSDRSRNRFANGRLEVSRIFDWFKEDFEPRERYFARYAGALGMPLGATPRLTFLDYDWSLNDSRSSSRR